MIFKIKDYVNTKDLSKKKNEKNFISWIGIFIPKINHKHDKLLTSQLFLGMDLCFSKIDIDGYSISK